MASVRCGTAVACQCLVPCWQAAAIVLQVSKERRVRKKLSMAKIRHAQNKGVT